jgi:hypothetical protein
MNIRDIVGELVAVAKTILPMVGGPAAGAAIAAAESVITLIDKTSAIFGENDQAELSAVRAELVARVNAHADSTIKRLSG